MSSLKYIENSFEEMPTRHPRQRWICLSCHMMGSLANQTRAFPFSAARTGWGVWVTSVAMAIQTWHSWVGDVRPRTITRPWSFFVLFLFIFVVCFHSIRSLLRLNEALDLDLDVREWIPPVGEVTVLVGSREHSRLRTTELLAAVYERGEHVIHSVAQFAVAETKFTVKH